MLSLNSPRVSILQRLLQLYALLGYRRRQVSINNGSRGSSRWWLANRSPDAAVNAACWVWFSSPLVRLPRTGKEHCASVLVRTGRASDTGSLKARNCGRHGFSTAGAGGTLAPCQPRSFELNRFHLHRCRLQPDHSATKSMTVPWSPHHRVARTQARRQHQ